MKLSIKYQEIDWWFWAVILVGIGAGLLNIGWGFTLALAVSVLNLAWFILREKSLVSFPVQVREVWLGLVLLAYYVAALGWFFYLLFLGMIMVVFFDRCSIALVLKQMPWNAEHKPG